MVTPIPLTPQGVGRCRTTGQKVRYDEVPTGRCWVVSTPFPFRGVYVV